MYALIEGGYNGSALQALLKVVPESHAMTSITERQLRERIALLAKANTHGKKFFATGGSLVCLEDFFKAENQHCWDNRVKELEDLK